MSLFEVTLTEMKRLNNCPSVGAKYFPPQLPSATTDNGLSNLKKKIKFQAPPHPPKKEISLIK